MKRNISRAAAIIAAACLSTAALSACDIDSSSSTGSMDSGSSSLSGSKDKNKDKDGEKKVRGCSANEDNSETPIKEDIDLGPITMNVIYFQPGEMMAGSMMLPYKKSAAHLEVDTKITKEGEKWGYTVGETPANMNMHYIIRDAAGKEVNSGMLMEMNAGDGSHYGTNIPAGVMKDGKYTVEIMVKQPSNYALHKDLVTGVKADGWWSDLTTGQIEWDYKTPVKSENPVRDCKVDAYQPVAVIHASENPDKKPTVDANGKCSEVEINVGSADAAPFAIDVNYFQPGGMLNEWLGKKTMMNSYQDSLMHLEADIKMVNSEKDLPVGAQATDYGYSNDETPAGLHVHYTILDKDGKQVDDGMFMEMNAEDGSHYGTNIKNSVKMEPGQYTLVLNIKHPTDYSLHIDNKTGVAVRHWYKDFEVKIPWKYTGAQKVCIVKPWSKAFPQPVPALENK